jgi:hypothetical protein
MRHVSEGVLRRLLEEPFAVPDTARRHLDECGRCRASSGQLAENAALATRVLTAPAPDTDTDLAWARLRERLADPAPARAAQRIPRHPARRVINLSAYTGVALTAGLVIGGVATAATLTTVFAPARVVPVHVNGADLRSVETVLGLGTSTSAGQVMPGGGRRALPFGQLSWSSAGPGGPVSSLAAARAQTHLTVTEPARLPAGVSRQAQVYVQPQASATIRFSASAGHGVSGTSLTVTGGPAVLIRYGGQGQGDSLTPMGILTMARPTARSSGATTSELESFLLSRPGLPASLVRQVRLLGSLRTVLPIPGPPGAQSQPVSIDGARGVLITVDSGVASAVIWEKPDGTIHAVAGLLSQKDVLDVARQLG